MTELEYLERLKETVQWMRVIVDEDSPSTLRLVTLRNLLTSVHGDLVDRHAEVLDELAHAPDDKGEDQ